MRPQEGICTADPGALVIRFYIKTLRQFVVRMRARVVPMVERFPYKL